jgi:hypothetical protein
MVKTSAATAEYLRGLTVKVKNGAMSKSEAKRLAILALQEVAEKEIEPEAAKGEGEEAAPVEAPAPAPKVSAIDPKTRILSLLTQFEEAIQGSLKKIEHDITTIVQETEGAAVPLGDFSIGNDLHHNFGGSASAKITIEAGDKPAQVLITYNLKKAWNVDGINLPVQASVSQRACHLPLRQDLLELCADVKESTGSELAWKRSKKLPLEQLAHIESIAKASGDSKVIEIVEGKPSDAQADSWKKWAVAGQAYLLGADWAEDRKFSAIKQGL